MNHTYRIEFDGSKPHYCRAPSDEVALCHFRRVRQQQMQEAKCLKLRVYKYQHAGPLWAGIDVRDPAQVWDIRS